MRSTFRHVLRIQEITKEQPQCKREVCDTCCLPAVLIRTGDDNDVNQLYIKKILNKHYNLKQKLEIEEEETTTWDKQGRQVLIVWRNLQLCE